MIRNNTKNAPSSKTTVTTCDKISPQSAFTTSLRDRPVVYSPQHIDDFEQKHSISTKQRRYFQLDEGSLQMTNDPNSVFYRHLRETLKHQSSVDTRPTEEADQFKLFEKYGPELVEFLKDKDGHLKSKFEKVFIT